jgi:hypothetical protein
MHQGEQAYGPQSPAQTHGRPLHSPTTAPLPAHHTNYHPHQHHRPPPSPSTTEQLPPISTALYSRDSAASKYYDPTSDHGQHSVARDTARYDNQYPPQVRTFAFPSQCPFSVTTALFICRDAELTLIFSRLAIHTSIQTLDRHTAPTRSRISPPSRTRTRINRRCSALFRNTTTLAAWRPCLILLSRHRCMGRTGTGALYNRRLQTMLEGHQ